MDAGEKYEWTSMTTQWSVHEFCSAAKKYLRKSIDKIFFFFLSWIKLRPKSTIQMHHIRTGMLRNKVHDFTKISRRQDNDVHTSRQEGWVRHWQDGYVHSLETLHIRLFTDPRADAHGVLASGSSSFSTVFIPGTSINQVNLLSWAPPLWWWWW